MRVFSEAIPTAATLDEVKRIAATGAVNDSPSRQLARFVAASAHTYLASVPASLRAVLEFRQDRFLRGGDHRSFNDEGFSAVRLTEWRENFDHQHQNVRVEDGVQYGDLTNLSISPTLTTLPGSTRPPWPALLQRPERRARCK